MTLCTHKQRGKAAPEKLNEPEKNRSRVKTTPLLGFVLKNSQVSTNNTGQKIIEKRLNKPEN